MSTISVLNCLDLSKLPEIIACFRLCAGVKLISANLLKENINKGILNSELF